jgi:hypothetical protein
MGKDKSLKLNELTFLTSKLNKVGVISNKASIKLIKTYLNLPDDQEDLAEAKSHINVNIIYGHLPADKLQIFLDSHTSIYNIIRLIPVFDKLGLTFNLEDNLIEPEVAVASLRDLVNNADARRKHTGVFIFAALDKIRQTDPSFYIFS